MNKQIGARAFTYGQDIYFGAGQYNPESSSGKKLLAHELAHTVQQRKDVMPQRIQRKPAGDVITDLNTIVMNAPADKDKYLGILRKEDGAHEKSIAVKSAIEGHMANKDISVPDAWRAVAILLFGNDQKDPDPLPLAVRNYLEGLESGQFKNSSFVLPSTKDEMISTSVYQGHEAMYKITGKSGPFITYQGVFNSYWDTSPFSTMTAKDDLEFDQSLSSKGPRTKRSRAIFEKIYNSDPQFKKAYDKNKTGIVGKRSGMKTLVDQYIGPESLNLIVSPRLHDLRKTFFKQRLIRSNDLSNAKYVAFKNTIQPIAVQLDPYDREVIKTSHEWRTIIERTVKGKSLRSDLRKYLRDAYRSVAPPPAPKPKKTAKALTPDQEKFIKGLNIQYMAPTKSAMDSKTENKIFSFFGESIRDPAGLDISSKIKITPKLRFKDNTSTKKWKPGSKKGEVHRLKGDVKNLTAGFTEFTASLEVDHPIYTFKQTPKTKKVKVNDKRLDWFKAHIEPGVFYTDQNSMKHFDPGDSVHYFGGQQPLEIEPYLYDSSGPVKEPLNRGLDISVNGELLKNGTSAEKKEDVEFGPYANKRVVCSKIILQGSNATKEDDIEAKVDIFSNAASIKSFTHSFKIQKPTSTKSMADQKTDLLAQADADYKELNAVGKSPNSVLDDMLASKNPQQVRLAETIQEKVLILEPTLIRPDSAKYVRREYRAGREYYSHKEAVAYHLGHTAVSRRNTLVGEPGAIGWYWNNSRFRSTIFINLTPSMEHPGTKRDNKDIIELITHEAIHALDRGPGTKSTSDFENYRSEFRAYWNEGNADIDKLSTAYDKTMDNRGPKSPRARAIFEHMYGNPTYPFVKKNYDKNKRGFRDKVNAYLFPEGINLIGSHRLENLRKEIAGYRGKTKKQFRDHFLYLAISTIFLSKDEINEIKGNRSWKKLVEKTYWGKQEKEVKNLLKIP